MQIISSTTLEFLQSTANANFALYTRNPLGQVTKVETPEVTYTYTYDAAHRLETATDSRGGKTLTYGYSDAGLLLFMDDNDGNQTDYEYDPAGRLAHIWAPNNDLISFIYDDGGRLKEKWFPNGVNTQYSYNPDNTVQEVINRHGTGNIISLHDYTYDGVGNRATHNETIGGVTNPLKYVYDELNWLREVRNNSTNALIESYSYDPLGNRIGKTAGATTLAYVYDASNQLTEIHNGTIAGPLTAGLVYDNNGNLTKKCEGGTVTVSQLDCSGTTVTGLTYDSFNRVGAVSKTGISTQNYLYDDQGRRIQKTASAPVNYLYNGSQIVNQYDSGWTLPNFRFTYGPGADAPTTRANSTGSQYYHQNGIGNVVAVTNQAGATDGTAAYDPWGNLSTSTGTIPAYGFTGREPDETGLIYYRARYYDPTIGRFAETDPIGLKGGLNRYQYVGNNPILYTDSSGLCRDPGGSGIRYCIDTYIPQDWVWSVPSLNIQGFKGDNRGPQAYGGTLGGFRTEQLIYQGSSGTTTSSFRPGVSTFCAFGGCVSADAVAGAAGFSVQDQAAGGRIIQAYGAASDGLFHGAAPNASYNLRIFESGDANATAWVIGAVTPYPNTEVWQYGGPNGPQLILNYDSAKAGADTRDLLGPLPFDPYGGTLIDVGTCSNCTPAPRSQTLDSFNFDKGSVTSPNK